MDRITTIALIFAMKEKVRCECQHLYRNKKDAQSYCPVRPFPSATNAHIENTIILLTILYIFTETYVYYVLIYCS